MLLRKLFEEMNNADLAIMFKNGAADKPENCRPVALRIKHKPPFSKMVQARLCTGLDEHLDSHPYGFRTAKSTSQPVFIYRRILEIHEAAGLEMYTYASPILGEGL